MDQLIVLGTRGSIPVSGKQYMKYGGASTCFLLKLGGEVFVIDAGTGILALTDYLEPGEKHIHLLMTHFHADHVMGYPMCSFLYDRTNSLDFYGKTRNGLVSKEQLRSFMQSPLWPVGPDVPSAKAEFHELPERFSIGAVQVESRESKHPGGVSLLRLSSGGRSVVIATDCTLDEDARADFVRFAKGCDLLLIDGQYSDEEFAQKAHFGHNSRSIAARMGRESGASRTLIVHHDPFASDDELDGCTGEFSDINPSCCLAYEGMEVLL